MTDSSTIDFAESIKKRTKKFVVDNIRFFRTLPEAEEAKIIGRQLLCSSSSVGSNYRATCRARPQAEFHAKLSIVVEEADESVFWMEVLVEADIVKKSDLDDCYSNIKNNSHIPQNRNKPKQVIEN